MPFRELGNIALPPRRDALGFVFQLPHSNERVGFDYVHIDREASDDLDALQQVVRRARSVGHLAQDRVHVLTLETLDRALPTVLLLPEIVEDAPRIGLRSGRKAKVSRRFVVAGYHVIERTGQNAVGPDFGLRLSEALFSLVIVDPKFFAAHGAA